MKKIKSFSIILILVLVFLGNFLISQKVNSEENIPDFFEPSWAREIEFGDPSDDFITKVYISDDKKKNIKNWVKNNSWSKARKNVLKTHTKIRQTKFGEIGVRLITPIYNWVTANYIGNQKFWSNEKINKYYQNQTIASINGKTFRVIVQDSPEKIKNKYSTSNENIYKIAEKKVDEISNDLRFGLEDNNKNRWKTEGVIRDLENNKNEYVMYKFIDVLFDFNENQSSVIENKDFSKLNFHIIRENKVKKYTFKWNMMD